MNPAEAMAQAAQVENALRILDPYFQTKLDKIKSAVFDLPLSGKQDEIMKNLMAVKLLKSIWSEMRADVQSGEAARREQQQADKIAAMGPEAAKWAGR